MQITRVSEPIIAQKQSKKKDLNRKLTPLSPFLSGTVIICPVLIFKEKHTLVVMKCATKYPISVHYITTFLTLGIVTLLTFENTKCEIIGYLISIFSNTFMFFFYWMV